MVGKNYINGKWITSAKGAQYDHYNPADLTEVTGSWPKSTVEDVQVAIQAAQNAFIHWRQLTVYQRSEYLRKALSLMRERLDTIAEVLTTENGKTLAESKAEIVSAIKEMDFQINEGLRMGGRIMPSERDGILAFGIRAPLGVVAVISPWNFPFNVPARKITPALMTGNTCILKPANLTPGVGAEFVKLFDQAGLPAGVLNFLTGSGAVIGQALVENPAIKAITFTGSTDVGMGIHKAAAIHMTRTQLEMGGKNPLVVLADADLEEAANAAVLAAYACAGQWCTSTSRTIVEENIYDEFLTLVLERVKKISVGRGTDPQATMGPVCGKSQLAGILDSIQKGKAQGAKLIIGGRQIKEGELARGCFIEPTIFTEVTPDMFIAQEEIFGPVLSVIKVRDFDQAVQIANQVKFGLSSSIFTKDLGKALTFVEKTDVGLTHVNMPTAFKEPQLSFGGVKQSGCGLPEAGDSGVEFFTEHKVAYIKYR
ncbi:MAG: aldehyde dehydrogenase family protein [Sedimentisphaerales bacterium]|nr:aldehyde dehydrogenase family protein [Sedimentisphaerales bacterium]